MRSFLLLGFFSAICCATAHSDITKKKDLDDLVGDYKKKAKESNSAVEAANEDQKAKLIKRQKTGSRPVTKESLIRNKDEEATQEDEAKSE